MDIPHNAINQFRHSIRKVARQFPLLSEEDVEDVIQEVFLAVHSKRDRIPTIGHMVNFVRTAARHAYLRRVRAKKNQSTLLERYGESCPRWFETIAMIDDDTLGVISTWLASLGVRRRAAVVRRYFDGESWPAISQSLAILPDTARLRAKRALDGLREMFQGIDPRR